MEIPLIKVVLALMTFSVVILGGLVNLLESHMPVFVIKALRYGKFAYQGPAERHPVPTIEVPKRWFKHFYVFAAVFTSFILWQAFSVYCGGSDVPEYMNNFLNILYTDQREATVSAGHVLVALMLLAAQCWRRFYETFCVSVFSEGRINIAQYMCGFIHYLAAASCILAEAPIFATTSKYEDQKDSGNSLTVMSVIAVGVFLWAFVHQFRAAVILANLRKNKEGKVVNTKHKVPSGDWFEYFSSPHLVAEMLMYVSLSVLLWPNSAWRFVLVWVLANQVETALLSHWWYKSTFKDYPKGRKALIPFIY